MSEIISQLMRLIKEINFKLFFYYIIPISYLIIAVTNSIVMSNEVTSPNTVRFFLVQLISIYFSAAIWLFLYSLVRGNLIDKRTSKINSSPLDFIFIHNERYINLGNYQMAVFVAWLISLLYELKNIV